MLQWSRSRKYLLSGGEHGTVHLSPASDLSHYWNAGPHDGSGNGRVSGVVTSLDDAFLVSGGGDGLCYVYQIEGEVVADTAAAEVRE